MAEPPPTSSRPPGWHLVGQDIQLTRAKVQGEIRVIASAHCVRKDSTMDVEDCAGCPHFVRIDTHEAGYVLVCRSAEADEHADDGHGASFGEPA
jgi:hypothetical protein